MSDHPELPLDTFLASEQSNHASISASEIATVVARPVLQ